MRKYIASVFALICVLALAACSDRDIKLDIGEASKINIQSPYGEITISDNAFIHSITENINSLRFEKASAADGEVDYVYLLTWFDAENTPIANVAITEENGHQIRHNGYYYKVGADLCIDVELIDETIMRTLSSSILSELVPVSSAIAVPIPSL